jgi:hypothetical protein
VKGRLKQETERGRERVGERRREDIYLAGLLLFVFVFISLFLRACPGVKDLTRERVRRVFIVPVERDLR